MSVTELTSQDSIPQFVPSDVCHVALPRVPRHDTTKDSRLLSVIVWASTPETNKTTIRSTRATITCVCDVREISKPQLSQRRYVVLEGDTTRCFVYLQLQSASMTSLVTTRREGRTWYLVRSRVIVTSLFPKRVVVNDRHKLVSKNGCLEPRKLESLTQECGFKINCQN